MSDTHSTTGDGPGSYRPDLQEKAQAAPTETILAPLQTPGGTISATAVPVAVEPTQIRRPWRSTARTIFQAAIALAAMWALIVAALGLPDWAWVSASVAAAGGITRVMALPEVEAFLRTFVPFLAASKEDNR